MSMISCQGSSRSFPPDKQFGASNVAPSGVLMGVADAVAPKCLFFIHAAKTEIVVVGRPTTLPTWKLSSKELLGHW
eukprot:351183-Chlamydomonas_euryale.AAC.2